MNTCSCFTVPSLQTANQRHRNKSLVGNNGRLNSPFGVANGRGQCNKLHKTARKKEEKHSLNRVGKGERDREKGRKREGDFLVTNIFFPPIEKTEREQTKLFLQKKNTSSPIALV